MYVHTNHRIADQDHCAQNVHQHIHLCVGMEATLRLNGACRSNYLPNYLQLHIDQVIGRKDGVHG